MSSQRLTRQWLVFLAQQLQKESQTEFLIEKIQPNCLKNKCQNLMYSLGTGIISGFISGISIAMIFGAFDAEVDERRN
jgi:hypothetical protein